LVHTKSLLDKPRADELRRLRAVYFPVLHNLPIVLDDGVNAQCCRRDHGGYPPQLRPNPI
ncbi:hypothetical protein A2U01_0091556, partial [Trifolium medium]|nr:hypothetical protein [Trifolium medium]